MRTMDFQAFADDFDRLIAEVDTTKERIILTRDGVPVAAIISDIDLDALGIRQ